MDGLRSYLSTVDNRATRSRISRQQTLSSIRRTTYHLMLTFTIVHVTNVKTLRGWMFFDLRNFSNDYVFTRESDFLDIIDL